MSHKPGARGIGRGLGVILLGMLLSWSAESAPIAKPCPHRPGSPKSWEGDYCSGNLQLMVTLSVIDVGLIYNSVDSSHQEGFGYGWRLNVRSRLVRGGDGSVTIIRPDGTPVTFTWDGSSYRPEPQLQTRLTKDSADTFTESYIAGTRVVYKPFSGGEYFLYQIVDRNGNETTIQRDNQNRETALADSYGRTMEFQWNGERLAAVTDHEGRVFTLQISQEGELESITKPALDAGVPVERFTSGANHLIAFHRSPSGMITEFSYHEDGSLKTVIEPAGLGMVVQYTADSVVREFSSGEQIIERYQNGAVSARGNHLGFFSSFERDSRHRVTKSTDPLGHVSTYAYNDNDDMVLERDPKGLETKAEYDDNHNLLTLSRRGKTWRYQYDAFNQMTAETNPLGETDTFQRDERGNLTQVIDYNGDTRLQIEYNRDGTVRTLADPYGQIMSLEHDSFGNLSSLEHPAIGTVVRHSSPMGLLLYLVDSFGDITAFSYNALGELIGWLYPADPSILDGGPRGDGAIRQVIERDPESRVIFQELGVGGNSRSSGTGFDEKSGTVNRRDENGNVIQDGPCPCNNPEPDGDDGTDGGSDGGGMDSGGLDGTGGADTGGIDGGGSDASGGVDAGETDGGGTDGSVGPDGGGSDGGYMPDGSDEEECPDADPPADECQAMGQVGCGQTVSGSTGGSTMTLFTPCSEDIPFEGGEYIYEFIPDSDSMHASALLKDLPEGLDLDVFVLESACRSDRCKEKGSLEAYFGVVPCRKPYYIVVKGYEPDDTGPFTLEVTCFN